MTAPCPYCGAAVTDSARRGRRFCAPACRTAFHTLWRRVGERLHALGVFTVPSARAFLAPRPASRAALRPGPRNGARR